MSTATATVQISLPTTRTDGSAFAAADYGGAHIFRAGTKVGTIAAPALTFSEPLAPGTYDYTASIFDAFNTESAVSAQVAEVIPVPAAPTAPTIAVKLS